MRVDKTKWEKKILSSCCDVINGDRGKNYPAKSKLSIEGDYPFISAINLQGYTVSSTDLLYLSTEQYNALSNGKIQKGDIALCIRGSLGKFGFFPFENGAIASSLVILRSKDNLYQKFLGYYLRSCCFGNQILENNNGVAQPNLAANKLSRFLIRVPEYNIQVNIASELDSLQEVIDGYKEQLSDLDALAQSIFLDIFGDPVTNPKGWEITPIKKVVLPTKNINWRNNLNSYKYIDLTSIDKENKKIIGTVQINAETAPSRAKQIVCDGDVLFGTTRPTQMRATIIDGLYNNQICSTGYCVLRPDLNLINPYVLFNYLQTELFKQYLSLKEGGAAYPAVSNGVIFDYSIPLPPLSLQQQFATQVEAIEQQKELIRLQLADAETLMAERMQYYFS